MDAIFFVRWIPGLMKAFGWGALLWVIYRFPDGQPEPRWTRWMLIAWVGFPPSVSRSFTILRSGCLARVVLFVIVIVVLVGGLIAQLVRYHEATGSDKAANPAVLIQGCRNDLDLCCVVVSCLLSGLNRGIGRVWHIRIQDIYSALVAIGLDRLFNGSLPVMEGLARQNQTRAPGRIARTKGCCGFRSSNKCTSSRG
jgi:hypothetical protein